MHLGPMYHWSPRSRREKIRAEGLQPYSHGLLEIEGEVYGFPYVCFSTSPAKAWRLSGDMGWASEIEEWDLWEVTLSEQDEIHVNAEFGPEIKEVRTRNAIPADRVWWVAMREVPCAEPKGKH